MFDDDDDDDDDDDGVRSMQQAFLCCGIVSK